MEWSGVGLEDAAAVWEGAQGTGGARCTDGSVIG